jgi:DNA replication protein DnaC
MRPPEFRKLSAERAPRPEQFKLVAEYFTCDGMDKFDGKNLPEFGVLAFGASRTGKTAAAWHAVDLYWHESFWDEVVFLKSVRFVRIAKARHLGNDSKAEFDALFESALAADLLIIDDLGTERLPESAEEVLFELLDSRTENHAPTIITSNYRLEELSEMFSNRNREKIAARLRQFFLPVNFDYQMPPQQHDL